MQLGYPKQRLPPALITSITLDGNDIERHGASLLAEYLKTNQHLEHLSLKWNMIGAWLAGLIDKQLTFLSLSRFFHRD